MANIQIPNLTPIISLNGTEQLEAVQGGVSGRITTSQLALLATGQPIPFPISAGGTGATTAAGARTNLGLGTMAIQNANAVAITGGTVSGISLTLDSIDSTPIGSITPSTGIFTTIGLTAAISSTSTKGALNYGTLAYSDTNIFASFAGNVNASAKEVITNASAGAAASASLVVGNNSVTATTHFGALGINSSAFTGSGAFNAANSVFLTSTTGDLAIGTKTSNAIHFVVNNGATDAITISSAGVTSLGTPLAVGSGGTGAATFTDHGVILGSGTAAISVTAVGTTGQVLTGNTGADPTWAAATGVSVTSLSFGTTGLTPNSATQGAITVAGTLVVGNGGTGQSSNWTQWGAIYASTTGVLASTATGTTGQPLLANSVSGPAFGAIALGVANVNVSGALTVTNGGIGVATLANHGVLVGSGTGAISVVAVGNTGQLLVGNTAADPTWSNATSVAVTSLSFGTTGLTPNSATQGAITVAGTLIVGNGGTGVATLASNGVLFGNGTGVVQVTAQGAANSILTANAGAPSFSATPTIGTSVTVPLAIGGTGAASSLTLQSTSGVGTTDTILFKTGNAGAVTALTIASNGNATFLSTSTTAIGTLSLTNDLTVPNGGTGVGTLASNGVLYGNGAGVVQVTAQGIANSILTANAGAPSFSDAPTVGTSVTTPLVIGGTAVGSALTLQSTTGVGSTDKIVFKVGNAGATTAVTIASAGAFLLTGAGTTTVPPLKLTAGTNMTTTTAGAFEFDATNLFFSTIAATRATIPTEQIVVLNTAYTLTNATGVQQLFNNTANGAVTLTLGTYQFECYATISALPVTGTFGFALAGSATYTQAWWATAQRVAAGTGGTSTSSFNTTANTALTLTSATTTAYMWIRGIINLTANGTVIPQFSMTTTAAAAVIGVGSYFKISPFSIQRSTNNVTTGNWS